MSMMFNELAGNARAWVYQSNRPFTPEEVAQIQQKIDAFVVQWTSHSRQVIASGKLLYDRFVILVADESAFQVSGCSIDSSVHFIKALSQEYGVDFFDRFNIAYKEGDTVKAVSKDEFQQLLERGMANEDTTVFNNMITTHAQLDDAWEVPMKQSWHANFFQLA